MLRFTARPCSAAMSPQYLKTALRIRETLRSLCTPCTACGLLETRDESSWLSGVAAATLRPCQESELSHPDWHQLSSAENPCGAAVLPPPHDGGVKVRGHNLLLSGLLLVIVSSFLAGKFPVWLCCFLLQFGILLPCYFLSVKADASLLPCPGDCELVGLVARNLISFWNASKSLVLVGIFPDLAGLEFCNVQLEWK